MSSSRTAIGLLETTGWTPAIVALDAMEKAARIRVFQAELNDFLGVVIKFQGEVSDVETAIRVGHTTSEKLGGQPVSQVLARPSDEAIGAIVSRPEYNPLIQQDVVHPVGHFSTAQQSSPQDDHPDSTHSLRKDEELPVADSSSEFAIGFIETQGFTAVFDAIDTACKAANVEVIGKEKLGGGYVTVVIRGDVAAVHAAIESGRQRVEGLGKLIAAHVIPRPSSAVLALLPAHESRPKR